MFLNLSIKQQIKLKIVCLMSMLKNTIIVFE